MVSSELAHKLHAMQELLAERDVALASIAQASLARLTAEDEEMNAVLTDMQKLGAALHSGALPAHALGPQSSQESLALDHTNAKIEEMQRRVTMLSDHKSKLEAAVAKLQAQNANLLDELGVGK